MHPNAQLIQRFYSSFQNLDSSAMKGCYHADVQFSDPAFPNLKGAEAGEMWSMLTDSLKKSNNPWRLEFGNIQATDSEGSCHWEAHYTLSSTGRKVHNIIDAQFQFKDGLIIRHTDHFDFHRWARQGFGFSGVLMGWTGFFKGKVQGKVKHMLDQYIAKQTST